MSNQSTLSNINSRRNFIRQAGSALIFVTTPISLISPKNEEDLIERTEGQQLSVWVKINLDNTVTIANPTNEMGQGSMTALAVLLVEELDADWSKVKLVHSPVDPEIYGSQGWSGYSMMTVGSRTVSSYYDSMRQAGAQARYVILDNVARYWSVSVDTLITKSGLVIHPASDRQISYGEVAKFAEPLDQIPEIPKEKLKKPDDFQLIGKVVQRFDIPGKVDGSAQYAMDINLPNMTYGMIARSPVHGGRPTLTNEQSIRNMEGVIEIVRLEHGIGVIASSIDLAFKAKAALSIQWSEDNIAQNHNSQEEYEHYLDVANSDGYEYRGIVDTGNIEEAFAQASKTYKSDYKNDYVCHAQMEPLNAVISIPADHSSAEIWVGTQSPARNKTDIASMLGIDESKVTIHRQYLGGGFGRRAISDWIEEAVHLGKAVDKPVKLIWSREDDMQYGMYRPMSLQRLEAAVDSKGSISGWKHLIMGTGGGLLSSGAEIPFYQIPHQSIRRHDIDHGIRTKHWRAVGHGPNKFAIESFIDEIAVDLQKDPLDFRLQLMKDHPRAQKVLEAAAKMSDWYGRTLEGRAKGIAFAERSGSLAACVCEISVGERGGIHVHHVWSALDGGIVVQPDNVVAQMEGGIIMGLSSVLKESITISNGKVQQSNYHDYPILRIDEIPESIEVEIIPSDAPPTGIGESGVPIVGGAVANAFFKLTGKHLRHLPFTPEKVLQAIG